MQAASWIQLGCEAIDRVWIETATRCGFRVLRSDAAYASSDGRGTIVIGEPATLDDDDSVAQLVLHEICHALVQGAERARRKDLDRVLAEALARTAALLRAEAGAQEAHPLGLGFGPADETCGSCAWRYVGGRGTPVERCRQSVGEVGDGARVSAELRACAKWEPPVDCFTCGACCREAYHTVSVSVRDPV